ncbi:germination protein BB [Paenibacillus montaniterrae]|uniref:Germination protein BB n=1 Tax=Paenibacillus montaniterrae TaxID=429341 RepID=A0A919YPH6_9BACL|nr:GerAB/ArcD/ProY family transporter [Paenibacillus montaniterrae]GIP17280.1 germination protein BB [Paenibacillus montaniterrae]
MFTRSDDKITSTQASIFLTDSVLGAGILTMPRAVVVAGETPDVWLSVLLGGLIVMVLIVVMVKLSQQFPEKTVFQYAGIVIGKVPAFILCWLLIIFFITIAGFEVRVLAEVTLFFLLEGTPMWATMIPFIWVSGYLLFGGLNATVRLFQLILPVSLFVLIVSYLLSIRIFEVDNLLPVLGDGLLPVFKGLKATVLIFAGFEVVMFLVAHMQHPEKAIKAMIAGISVPLAIYFFTIIFVIGGMSIDAILRSTWPTIDLLRSFEVAGLFFERLEFPFLVIWMMQLFCNFTCYFFGASLGISQLLRIKFRPVIFAMMPIIYLASVIPQDINDLFALGDIIGWSGIILFCLIPLPLSIIWLIRRKGLRQDA